MIGLRTHDDAGRSVPVYLRALGLVWQDRRASMPAWTLRSAPRRIARIVASGPVLIAAGLTAILAILAAVAWSDKYAGFGLVLFSPIFVPLITAALVGMRGIAGGRSRLIDAMQVAMLARHACPACGYEMGRIPAGQDGLVLCPECRASWAVERLGDGGRTGEVIEITDWQRPVTTPDDRST